MPQTQLSQKYQIVVPKAIREKMQLSAGSILTIHPVDSEHAVLIKYPKSYTRALKGLGKDVWKKLGGSQQYIQNERSSWGR